MARLASHFVFVLTCYVLSVGARFASASDLHEPFRSHCMLLRVWVCARASVRAQACACVRVRMCFLRDECPFCVSYMTKPIPLQHVNATRDVSVGLAAKRLPFYGDQ